MRPASGLKIPESRGWRCTVGKQGGSPVVKQAYISNGNRGLKSSRSGSHRVPCRRWAQVLKEARQHLISSFSLLHSGSWVPSTGVEGLLLALWESLVAFPVLWKKNGPCLNSRKCLSSFRIDKKRQPHWLFTVRTNQLLTDPIVLCRLAGAGQWGVGGLRGHWNLYFISFFSLYFYIFCFLGKGWFHYSPRKTRISWISHLECISLFDQEKGVWSFQKSPLLRKRRYFLY